MDICEIRIYDPDFNWVGAAHMMESVQFERFLYGSGMFEIHIHPDKAGAFELARHGNIVIINGEPEKSGIVRSFRISEEKGKAEFVIYGETGSGLLKQRLVVPPTNAQVAGSGGWDKFAGDAESALKHYVQRNMTEPFDAKRIFDNFIIAPNLNRGGAFEWQARYTVLLEELEAIGTQCDTGFQVYADLPNKQWVFDIIEGNDRSKNQSELSPVSFNLEYQNVSGYDYSEEYTNYRNTAYVGGKGENERRQFYIAGAENEGRERYEVFINGSSAANNTELRLIGNQKISEYSSSKTIEASALPKAFIYGRDYFLGDAINLYLSRLNLDITAKVTASKEIWERRSGYKTEIRFGEKLPNIFSVLFNRTRQEAIM